MKKTMKWTVAIIIMLMIYGVINESYAQNGTLTKEQRKAFLHYYSPIIMKRTMEGGNQLGWDWMTNWYFDNQDVFNAHDKRAAGAHLLRDNRDNWKNHLNSYIVNQGAGFPNWDIRPTIYTSILEFMENDANEIPKKCLILMYHPYQAVDKNNKIHDWECIVLRIDGISGNPGSGEQISYAVITRHLQDFALKAGQPELNFYIPANGNGKHILIWRAQWDANNGTTSDEYNGAELHFVKNTNVLSLTSNNIAQTEVFNYNVYFTQIPGNPNPIYNLGTCSATVNFQYIFVDEMATGAVQNWNATKINSQNALSLTSGKNINESVTMSQVKKITYELQDIADILPTMDHSYDWTTDCFLDIVCVDFEVSDFNTSIQSEDGAYIELPSDNDNRHFYPASIGDDRSGYVAKDWFVGLYGLSWYWNYDGINQHSFSPMRKLNSPNNNWSNNAQNSNRYSLPNNWHDSLNGGFDGRWAQLFEDSDEPFVTTPMHDFEVTNEYGMTDESWSNGSRKIHKGDFNGDGKDDILLQGLRETVYTYLLMANSTSTFIKSDITDSFGMTARRWRDDKRILHVGDFNGDGRKDILLQGDKSDNQTYLLYGRSSGNVFTDSFDISGKYGMNYVSWSNDEHIIHVGDFNGDGKDDILLQGRSESKTTLILFGQTGTGFVNVKNISDNQKYGTNRQMWGFDRRLLHVGDFNGDGRDDILLQNNADNRAAYMLMSKTGGSMDDCFQNVDTISNGDNYNMTQQAWGADRRILHLGDFNGDGRTDILLQGRLTDKENYLLMAKQNGSYNNWFENVVTINNSFGMNYEKWAACNDSLHVLDIDGNGSDDILLQGKSEYNSTSYLLKANSSALFDLVETISYQYGMDQKAWGNDRRVLHTADFNGDGRDDILLQGRTDSYNTYLIFAIKDFFVQISGPTSRTRNQSGTWTARTVGGDNTYAYQWFKNGTSIGTTKSITTSGTSNFTLKVVATASNYGLKDSSIFNVTVTGVIDPIDKTAGMPTHFALYDNYPNPFNPTTTIKYALKEDVKVSLKIYNILGQEVRTLVNDNQSAGFKQVMWDGKNNNGSQVTSGIYVYRLIAGDFVKSHKMMLMK